jgi:hypothetical protein
VYQRVGDMCAGQLAQEIFSEYCTMRPSEMTLLWTYTRHGGVIGYTREA